jgi:hypothetical protein
MRLRSLSVALFYRSVEFHLEHPRFAARELDPKESIGG